MSCAAAPEATGIDLLPLRAQLAQVALDRQVRWPWRIVAVQNAKRGLLVERIAIERLERPEVQIPQKHIADPWVLFFGAPHCPDNIIGLLIERELVAKLEARRIVLRGPAVLGDPDLVVAQSIF